MNGALTTAHAHDLRVLLGRLADAAARETLPRFRRQATIDNKLSDGFDPVTEADREAERAIRAILDSQRPDDAIIGEEFGTTRNGARDAWIVDPVDGTRAFVAGLPVWGTLIGLYRDGAPLAGLVDQPFTGERFIGLAGHGATLATRGGAPAAIAARDGITLADATLMTTSPRIFPKADGARYDAVERQVRLARYGCDCYAYAMLAAGQIDLVIESGLHVYDIAGPLALMRAAGATVTDWNGGDPSAGGQILAAGSARLHAEALEVLNA